MKKPNLKSQSIFIGLLFVALGINVSFQTDWQPDKLKSTVFASFNVPCKTKKNLDFTKPIKCERTVKKKSGRTTKKIDWEWTYKQNEDGKNVDVFLTAEGCTECKEQGSYEKDDYNNLKDITKALDKYIEKKTKEMAEDIEEERVAEKDAKECRKKDGDILRGDDKFECQLAYLANHDFDNERKENSYYRTKIRPTLRRMLSDGRRDEALELIHDYDYSLSGYVENSLQTMSVNAQYQQEITRLSREATSGDFYNRGLAMQRLRALKQQYQQDVAMSGGSGFNEELDYWTPKLNDFFDLAFTDPSRVRTLTGRSSHSRSLSDTFDISKRTLRSLSGHTNIIYSQNEWNKINQAIPTYNSASTHSPFTSILDVQRNDGSNYNVRRRGYVPRRGDPVRL